MNDYRTTNDLGETRTWEELYEDNLLFNKAYKDLKQENNQLREEIEELKQAKLIMIDYQDLEQRNIELNSILTELEEWLNRERNDDSEYSSYERFTAFDETLDKIQELKEKYK